MKPKYTRLYRFWHWLMALSVIGLLFTVLLRKTFLSWHTNAALIQSKLAETGTEITTETAKMIAKAIRAPMWEWHYIFGLFLGMAILIRIYMLLTKKWTDPLTALIQAPKEEKLQRSVYLFLCLALLVMALTGATLYYHEALGFTDKGVEWVKELHENLMYGVLGLVVLHLGGVFGHEITTKEGIVSKMIHGDE
ncbi:MAG: cytochrome b/b6 domain-containing protein [Thiovulaceae bacterium]|nr:cytochrome b/b6 domain-containing protein [Sulfurimonadaceae bacterium]